MFDSSKSRFYWVSHLFLGIILIMLVRILARNSGNFKARNLQSDHKGKLSYQKPARGECGTLGSSSGELVTSGLRGKRRNTQDMTRSSWRDLLMGAEGQRRTHKPGPPAGRGWQEQVLGFLLPASSWLPWLEASWKPEDWLALGVALCMSASLAQKRGGRVEKASRVTGEDTQPKDRTVMDNMEVLLLSSLLPQPSGGWMNQVLAGSPSLES